MAHQDSDLASAMDKLAAVDFSSAEAEAVAAYLSATLGEESHAETAGFSHNPARSGFLLEVAGRMQPTSTNWSWGASQSSSFTATDDLARINSDGKVI